MENPVVRFPLSYTEWCRFCVTVVFHVQINCVLLSWDLSITRHLPNLVDPAIHSFRLLQDVIGIFHSPFARGSDAPAQQNFNSLTGFLPLWSILTAEFLERK